MTKKFYKNEKFQTWFFSILYFLMAIAIVITSCFTFKKVYYLQIVVSGTSMWPTLSGAKWSTKFDDLGDGKFYTPRNNYGIADIHQSSVNSLHRFDVIATNYPTSWATDEDYKIKRVWGFPGETLNLNYNSEQQTYTFIVSKDGAEIYSITSESLHAHTQEYEFQHQESDGSYTIINHTLSFQVHTFVLEHKTFNVSYSTPAQSTASLRLLTNHKLADNEYFVMGDNWSLGGSADSYSNISKTDKLTKDYLQGRIICINSYVTYVNEEVSNEHAIEKRYDF